MRLLGPQDLMNGQAVEFRTGRGDGTESNPVFWSAWRKGVMHRQDPRVRRRGSHSLFVPRVAGMPVGAEYTEEDYEVAGQTWLVEDYYLQVRLPED